MLASRNQTIKHTAVAALIFALGLSCSALLFGNFGVLSWRTALAKRHEASSYKRSIDEENMYSEIRQKLQAQKSVLENRLNTLTSGFSDPKDLSALLQTIFDKAWKYGLKFEKTEPQTEKKEGLYTYYPIVFDLVSDYKSLAGFVSELERLPHMFHVRRVAVSASKNGKIKAKLLITCFLQPDSGN